MVEPSQRCQRSLEKMIQDPELSARFKYLRAAVGNPEEEMLDFLNARLWVDPYFPHPPQIAAMKLRPSPYQMVQTSNNNLSI